MTARAFPTNVLGLAPERDTLRMTEQETQRLVVLAGAKGVSSHLAGMCEALEIEVIEIVSHHDLPFQLHHHRPVGVVSELDPRGIACSAALRSIAAYDPHMPVLLVEGLDPTVLGTLDAVQQLWGLSKLTRLEQTPNARELIGFLFQAGRRAGLGRMMPIG